MMHAIIIISFVVVFSVMGASSLEVVIALGMTVAYMRLLTWSEQFVESRTGRTNLNPTESFKNFGFLIAMLIGLPPIFLFPHFHYLAILAIQILGTLISGICSQLYVCLCVESCLVASDERAEGCPNIPGNVDCR
jgi:hypothetical protein